MTLTILKKVSENETIENNEMSEQLWIVVLS